jgi:hypothetical protein
MPNRSPASTNGETQSLLPADPPPNLPAESMRLPQHDPSPAPGFGDNFDPSKFRLGQDYLGSVGVKKVLTGVRVQRPNSQEFFRVKNDSSLPFESLVLELKQEREIYLVAPELWLTLAKELTPKALYLCINRDGAVFFWPIRLPNETGGIDNWSKSAHAAASRAQEKWTRIMSNQQAGTYDVLEASSLSDEPVWPAESVDVLMRVAFQGRIIDSMDHPVLKRLRG